MARQFGSLSGWIKGRLNVKGLSLLSAVTFALVLGTSGALLTASTTDAQARARVTVYKYGTQRYYEARMAMCNANIKGLYRTQQDGYVFPYGFCLSDAYQRVWN
jgi:hypothetical protein